MSTIVTRAGKGSPLTNTELDSNFSNLNTDKAELSGANFTGSINVTGSVVADGITVDGGSSSPTHLFTGARAGTLVSIDNESTSTSYGLLTNTASVSANSYPLWVTSNDVNRLTVGGNGDISFYDSSGSSQNFYWDSSTSRLGLGVTNPQRTLETKGVGVLLANTGGAHEILFGDNAHRYFSLYTPSSPDSMAIRTGTTDLLTINADGSSVFSGSVTSTGLTASGTLTQFNTYNSASTLLGINIVSDAGSTSYTHPYLDFRRWTGSGTNHYTASIEVAPTNADANAIVFMSDTKSTNTKATTERLRINGDGSSVFSGTLQSEKLIITQYGAPALKIIPDPAFSNEPEHDLIYTGYQSNLQDYLSIKAAGNSSTFHGVLAISDVGIYFGRTHVETGSPVGNSATSPFDASNYGYINNTGLTVNGSVTADEKMYIEGTAPRLHFNESDRTDLNTALFSSGGTFTVRTINDADSLRTTRFAISNTTGDISFYNDSAAQGLFWDSSTSRLGLGTTVPQRPLHLDIGTNNTAARFQSTDTEVALEFIDPSGTAYFRASGNYIKMGATQSDTLTINADGSSVFSGSVTSTGLTASGTLTQFNTYNSASTLLGINIVSDAGSTSYTHPYLDFRRWTGSGTNHYTASIEVAPTNADANAIVFMSDTKSTNTKATTERLRINGDGSSVFSGTVTADGLTVDGGGVVATFGNTAGNNSIGVIRTTTSPSSAYLGAYSNTGVINYSGSGGFKFSNLSSNQDSLKIANNGDISFYEDTGTTPKMVWDASAESLTIPEWVIHDGNTATKFGFGSANTMNFISNGSDRLTIANSYAVFNDAGTDYDFRVESDSNTHMLFVDGGNNAVGINTSSPSAPLDVDRSFSVMPVNTTTVESRRGLSIYNNQSSGFVDTTLVYGNTVNSYFAVGHHNGTSYGERLRIDNQGRVGISNSSPEQPITVGDTSDSQNYIQIKTSATGAAGLLFSDGASTNPAGYLYDHATNSMQFKVNGSERLRIDSAGKILAGKSGTSFSSDGVELDNSLNSDGWALWATSDHSNTGGGTFALNRKSYDGAFLKFYKDTSTEVGSIGTFASRLYIGNGDTFLTFEGAADKIYPATSTGAGRDNQIDLGGSSSRFKDLYLSNNATAQKLTLTKDPVGTFTIEVDGTNTGQPNLIVKKGTSEALRIDNNNNLLVGTASGPVFRKLFVQSSNYPQQNYATNSSINYPVLQLRTAYATGGQTATQIDFRNGADGLVGTIKSTVSSTSYNTSSDQRLKENIADADDAGSKIDAIQVRKYDWKADGSHQDYGMIAQELQTVAPEAVSGDADSEEMMGVDYSKLVPMLIKEIQSLRQRVAQLEE